MAEHYGYSPPEVDALTMRDLAVMLRGQIERERRAWRHTITQVSATINTFAKKKDQKTPKELMPWAFGITEEDRADAVASTLMMLAEAAEAAED